MADSSVIDRKTVLRAQLRAARKAHVAGLLDNMRGLLFRRPPAPLLNLIPAKATIGLYHATDSEAPTRAYAQYFQEAGHIIALPRITADDGRMDFAAWIDAFEDSDLVNGPFGMSQPAADLEELAPQLIFVPLIGFTDNGARLGQGGGYYDRWLGDHPGTLAIGLAWDCQLTGDLPVEAHDVALSAVVTPTRLYGPF